MNSIVNPPTPCRIGKRPPAPKKKQPAIEESQVEGAKLPSTRQHRKKPAVQKGANSGGHNGLRNERPGLSAGRPPCKSMAIGAAKRRGRLGGGRALRIPPHCSGPVNHAGGPGADRTSRRVFVVDRPCAHARPRVLAWLNEPQEEREKTAGQRRGGIPHKKKRRARVAKAYNCTWKWRPPRQPPPCGFVSYRCAVARQLGNWI